MKIEVLEPVGPPWWDDRPVYIIGGGPSAKDLDLERLRGRARVLAINDCALALPWADAVASLDRLWMVRRRAFLAAFGGERWLGVHRGVDAYEAPIPGCRYVELRSRIGSWSTDPAWVCHGGNSGFFGTNLAGLKRAGRIRLVGFDMDGGHWHGGYPWNPGGDQRYYSGWAARFLEAAPAIARAGTSVWNCNPDSKIDAFPRCSFQEAIRADGLL